MIPKRWREIFLGLFVVGFVLLGGTTLRGATPPVVVFPQQTATDTIRVLTYNIHIGRGQDTTLDLERTAAVIRAARPDLVALQEVDSVTRRTNGTDEPARLAQLTGLQTFFARAMPYDGGAYGEAVLSRLPVLDHQRYALPADSGNEPRAVAALHVRLPHSGRTLLFLGTHLDHTNNPASRQMQVDSINQLFASTIGGPPAILAGDLNATPFSPAISTLLYRWSDASSPVDAPTFPANAPARKIDYVMLRPVTAFRILDSRVLPDSVASDHRPLLVVLEVR